MIVSYNWLQTYFKEKLPPAEKIAEILTFRAFEVESINKKDDDWILDVNILPDRAHDCLSHRGVARELAVHLGKRTAKKETFPAKVNEDVRTVSVDVKEPAFCRRYAARILEGVKIGPSPEWLRRRLEAIGQKPINNAVDAANFVMFDFGQPLHVFDADKISGGIITRKAKLGERMVTLDGREAELDGDSLVIADDGDPLAIAGIKGGRRAETTERTVNIVLESANFAPVGIRKTSRYINIQTDSSKRFENERSPEGVLDALEAVTDVILGSGGGAETRVGEIVDFYPRPPAPYVVGVSVGEVNGVLGTNLSDGEISGIFDRLGFVYKLVDPLEEVLALAPRLVGVPYQYGASVVYGAPRAFDCSSFTAYVFARAGMAIPRVSVDQYVFGEAVLKENLQPGDLVFSNSKNGKVYYETVEFLKGVSVKEGVDHCGLYLGNGKIIHATRAAGKVIIEDLKTGSNFKNVVGYRRIIPESSRYRFVVAVPSDRLDLRIKEDLIDEIGRVYGYENVDSRPFSPEGNEKKTGKNFFYVNKLRNVFVSEGFSEIYVSSFANDGEAVVENPIASDRKFLRRNLLDGLSNALSFNKKNAPLLGVETVKIFEIGKTFAAPDKETAALAFGVKGEGAFEETKRIIGIVSEKLGGLNLDEKLVQNADEAAAEINLDILIDNLPEPESYENVLETPAGELRCQKISPYPFVARDVAVWAPPSVSGDEVSRIILENAGELLFKGPALFDRFEKKNEKGEVEKISYAFRLVFQSFERTLTDAEVNSAVDKVTEKLNENAGWRVR